MMTTGVSPLLNIEVFPPELSNAIKGLSNEKRQKILIALYNEIKLSFSDLQTRTGLTASLLSNHLRKLKDSMLIERIFDRIVGKVVYSYYKITKYGKDMVERLFGLFYTTTITRAIILLESITFTESVKISQIDRPQRRI